MVLRRFKQKVAIRRTLGKNTRKRTPQMTPVQSAIFEMEAIRQGDSQVAYKKWLSQQRRERRQRAQELNKSRGKEKNSPYKLSGLGRGPTWGIDNQRAINQKAQKRIAPGTNDWEVLSGRTVAEINALNRWLKKPEAHRKEMEAWLKKYGRRK